LTMVGIFWSANLNVMKRNFFFIVLMFAACILRAEPDIYLKVTDELASDLSRHPQAKVAVFAIPYIDNRYGEEPFIASEKLTNGLARHKRLSVLERNHIVQILSELHLSETGVLDPKSAKRVGDALGADVIVTGTLAKLEKGTEINARGLFLGNGRIIAASRAVSDGTERRGSDPLKALSKELVDEISAKSLPSLAVLNFTYSRGRMSSGSYLVSERLVTYLFREGASLIERRLIPQIMEERKLWELGIVDSDSLKTTGQLEGVDAVVLGTLKDVSDTETEVMARVIETETGKILAASAVNVPRVWSDFPKVPRLAQARVAVPGFNPGIGMSEERMSHRLSETDSSKKRPEYYPAPVPFFMTPISKNSDGGFFNGKY